MIKKLIFIFLLASTVGHAQEHHTIFPEPASFNSKQQYFPVPEQLVITETPDSKRMQPVLESLFQDQHTSIQLSTGSAFVQLIHEPNFQKERYTLNSNSYKIVIHYGDYNGLLYAFQSLRQLIHSGQITAVEIDDQPAFGYRGAHLDCSRHFFTPDEIKNYLDELAYLKFNTFHWHLTDDQGWRLEIKQYPKLTTIGAWRDSTLIGHFRDRPVRYDHQRYGGFYTQEEARELIAYAAGLGIEVIPEIELPGHARAALAAYPELGCTGEKLPVAGTWGVFEEVFCTKDETIRFLENVLTEVAAIFPSKYIHIGGDEVPKANWNVCPRCAQIKNQHHLEDAHALQSYFIATIEKHVNTLGKSIIGWDEILEGGLAPNATVMSWRGMEGGLAAASMGHPVIMTPTTYCYFDYAQSSHPDEPLSIGGYLPLEKVYRFNPTEGVPDNQKHFILGAQANIWTEYIPTFEQVEYQAFPRLAAMSEIVWNHGKVPYDRFVNALVRYYLPHLDAQHKVYSRAFLDPKMDVQAHDHGITLSCIKPIDSCAIRINNRATDTLNLEATPQLRSQDVQVSTVIGDKAYRTLNYTLHTHAALGIPVHFKTPPHPKYNQHGDLALTDGIIGKKPWKGDEWLGFEEDTVVFELTFPKPTAFRQIDIHLLDDPGSWIYLPYRIIIEYTDKRHKKHTMRVDHVQELTQVTCSKKIEKISFTVINLSQIPEGQAGAGFTPWTFISELVFIQ